MLGREALVIPSIFHLGLSTTPLGNDGIGATEPTDPAYRRVAIPNDTTSFSVAANRITTIIREFLYQASTQPWGTCTHFMLFDNNVGGNVWLYGALQHPITVDNETSPWIVANTNQIGLDICGGSTNAMTLTTNASNSVLNHLFRRSPVLAPPPNFFMGVSTTPISTEGIGYTEPVGGAYARLQLPNDKNTFTMAANKSITLARQFEFANSTTPWGALTHFFITDTASGVGNVWWSGQLVHGRDVGVSTTLAITPGGFVWTLDSCIPVVGGTP